MFPDVIVWRYYSALLFLVTYGPDEVYESLTSFPMILFEILFATGWTILFA